jgi:subtilisin family serine protease
MRGMKHRPAVTALLVSVLVAAGLCSTALAVTTPDDQLFVTQWGWNNTGQTVNGAAGTVDADIDAPEAWDVRTDASSVTVAVIDDGIDPAQSDLAAPIVDMTSGHDFGEDDDDASSEDSIHGNQVAAILSANGDDGFGIAGVAWRTHLVPIKVRHAGTGGRNEQISAEDEAAGFAYAGQIGARVANASFSRPAASEAAAARAAIDASPGTLFVVSAGNNRSDNDIGGRFPCNSTAPNVICVAGTDENDALWVASPTAGSNWGQTRVDLAAPARNMPLLTALNTYGTGGSTGAGYGDGTSYAAPQVSGVAALYFAAYPTATVADVRNALLTGVDPVPSLSGKVASGGRLNAARTLSILPLSQQETPPAAPAIAPATGTYPSPQQVTMSAAAGTTIRYTTSTTGTPPADPTATSGTLYGGPFTVSTNTIVKAAAFNAQGTSPVTSRTYAFAARPAAPAITPPTGTYTAAQQVTMSAAAGTTIRYTTAATGTPPTPTASTGTLYSRPFAVSKTVTIRAAAFNAMGAGPVRERRYTFVPPPAVAPRPPVAPAPPGPSAPGPRPPAIVLAAPAPARPTVSLKRSQTLGSVVARGVRIDVRAAIPAKVVVKLRLAAADAQRLRLKGTIGQQTVSRLTGVKALAVRLTPAAARRLRRQRRVRLAIAVTASYARGAPSVVSRVLALSAARR